jgi:hypothetical protein
MCRSSVKARANISWRLRCSCWFSAHGSAADLASRSLRLLVQIAAEQTLTSTAKIENSQSA